MKNFNEMIPNGPALPGWKRALDLGLIVLASPLLVPLAILIGAFVSLVSKGPILFKQERIGLGGRKFLCFKFRTMQVGAESRSHQEHLRRLIESGVPMTKMDARGDRRIIPGGVFLRATGLDELPQLINVLRGDMSIVGPRPCLPYEFEHYLPWQRERCQAAPGLTGLWQVSGKNKTTFIQMIQLDIEYARRRSLLLDLEIIFKTIPALLAQVSETPKSSFPSPKRIAVEAEAILPAQAAHH